MLHILATFDHEKCRVNVGSVCSEYVIEATGKYKYMKRRVS